MDSIMKVNTWCVKAPSVPKETLKAFPSFKSSVMTEPKSKMLLTRMVGGSTDLGAAVVD